jgi:nucleoid-associated protein YgaU
MAKQALSITAIGSGSSAGGGTYKLLINPSEFSHEYTICYNTKRTQGQTGNPVRFSAVNPDKISFGVVFDGTGVVPPQAGTPAEVADQIDALSKVVYDYSGEQHEPNTVQILWGTLSFEGRLRSMSVNYTLFRSTGAPLRARAELAFIGRVAADEALLAANRSSPDLSHSVLVVEGDTLPLLCQRIYGDSRYYPEVAAFNGLRQFRRLQAGARLHFPPLR